MADLAALSFRDLQHEMLRVSTASVNGRDNPDYDVARANTIRDEMHRRTAEQRRMPTAREALVTSMHDNATRQLTGAREHLSYVLKNSGPGARELAERLARKRLDEAAHAAKRLGIATLESDFLQKGDYEWLG